MNPVFFVGSRYLLFLEEPYHLRSFERVTAVDDRWLTTVRARVLSRSSEFSQPILQWLKKPGLILYRVDRCATGDADRPTLTRLESLKDFVAFELYATDWRPVFFGRTGCRPGQVVLAIFYRSEARYVTTYPVIDGVIDLRLAEIEIKLLGPRRVSIKELKAFLR
jgi:hypothetical protein